MTSALLIGALSVDRVLVGTAVVANLLLAGTVWARASDRERLEALSAQILLLLAIPLAAVVWLNIDAGRAWWTIVLPLPLAAHLGLELADEHVGPIGLEQGTPARANMALYYAGLVGVTVYAFLVGTIYGLAVVVSYLVNLSASSRAFQQHA